MHLSSFVICHLNRLVCGQKANYKWRSYQTDMPPVFYCYFRRCFMDLTKVVCPQGECTFVINPFIFFKQVL